MSAPVPQTPPTGSTFSLDMTTTYRYASSVEAGVNAFIADNPDAEPTRVSISPGSETWTVNVVGRKKKSGGLIKFDYEVRISQGKTEVIGKEETR